MSENNNAIKYKTQRTYKKKCKFLQITYNQHEIAEYDRLQRYLTEYNLPKSAFIKNLIEKYLDNENFE